MMFLETVHSEGLAHMSYIMGDDGQAAVVDARRDCQVYVDIARKNNANITHIVETHRNEDYVVGSVELRRRTGAEIYHGKALDFRYGNGVGDGDQFELGDLQLRVLETPGHTYESISLSLHDLGFGEKAVAVCTGDALFIGDVGRTDFFPDRVEEVAGLLYDSIFKKLLSLGDQALLLPAHGAGSVCGGGIASREFSTIGYERHHNPALQVSDKREFIRKKMSEHHYQPPYFRKMEAYNLHGDAPAMLLLPQPRAMTPDRFAKAMDAGMQVVDVRSPEAFAGASIPGSLALPLDMIASFAGWFLDYERPIGIVPAEGQDGGVQEAVVKLVRMGYDDIVGFLADGLHSWETSARAFELIPTVHVKELNRRMEAETDYTLLDVRKQDEFDAGHLPNALHIYTGELPDRLQEVRRDVPVVTFCGSGRRAIIAASILKKNGFRDVENCLGSMKACSSFGCRIERKDD